MISPQKSQSFQHTSWTTNFCIRMTDFLGLILKLIFTQVAGHQTPVPSFCGELDLEVHITIHWSVNSFYNSLRMSNNDLKCRLLKICIEAIYIWKAFTSLRGCSSAATASIIWKAFQLEHLRTMIKTLYLFLIWLLKI